MFRGGFSRLTAAVGVATGLLGIASVAGPILFDGFGAAIIVASLLTTLWAFLVGYELLRRGRNATRSVITGLAGEGGLEPSASRTRTKRSTN